MNTIWSSSSGRIELELSSDQVSQGYHQGQCDLDIMALRIQPSIATQLNALNRNLVRSELKEYGAWDSNELSDHQANLDRLLWIACGDLTDGDQDEI
jgi:hypothetical protein